MLPTAQHFVSSTHQALDGLRRDATQLAKQAMLRSGLVPRPLYLQVDITDACNFRCPTCSKWRTAPVRKELTLEEWATALERLEALVARRRMSISGGEPFERADLLPFLRLAKQHGMYIVLITNGWSLTREVLDKLRQIGVDRLHVSLNHLDADTHDRTRAKPGSQARILQAIEDWQKVPPGMDLCLATVVSQANCGELVALTRYAVERGLTGLLFQVLAPVEVHYAFAEHRQMPPIAAGGGQGDPNWVRDLDTLRRQMAEVLRLQAAGAPVLNPPFQLRRFVPYYENPQSVLKYPCVGTLSRLYVDPYGDMRLCYGFPPIGNVLRDDPKRAWYSQQARIIRQESRKCTQLCRLLNNNL